MSPVLLDGYAQKQFISALHLRITRDEIFHNFHGTGELASCEVESFIAHAAELNGIFIQCSDL